jgi:hypothetical protein
MNNDEVAIVDEDWEHLREYIQRMWETPPRWFLPMDKMSNMRRYPPYGGKDAVCKMYDQHGLTEKDIWRYIERDLWNIDEGACLLCNLGCVFIAFLDGNSFNEYRMVHDTYNLISEGIDAGTLPYVERKKKPTAVRPGELAKWAFSKGSSIPVPRWMAQAYLGEQEDNPESSQPHGNTELNARRREQLLGSALYCIHHFPKKCTKDGKLVAKWIAAQITVHYETMWPNGGFVLFNEEHAANLIRDWLSTDKLE